MTHIARGDAEQLPIKKKKPKPKPMKAVAAWIERDGKILAVRRPEEGLMAGLWELPGGEVGESMMKLTDRVAEVLREGGRTLDSTNSNGWVASNISSPIADLNSSYFGVAQIQEIACAEPILLPIDGFRRTRSSTSPTPDRRERR